MSCLKSVLCWLVKKMSIEPRRNNHGRLLTAAELEYDHFYETTVASFDWRRVHSDEDFKLAWQRIRKLGEIVSREVIERRKTKRLSNIDFEWARTWVD